MSIVLMVVVAIGVLLLFWLMAMYNRMVALRQRFKNAFSQIDVQLKRRYDLIPNLVEAVKGYIKHERETLEAVIAARNQAYAAAKAAGANPGDAELMKKLFAAEGSLGGAMVRVNALAEQYPDLKASQNMRDLQEELTSTENKISFARQGYNDSVTSYNTYIHSFPPLIFARMFVFQEAVLFQVEETAKAVPQVKF